MIRNCKINKKLGMYKPLHYFLNYRIHSKNNYVLEVIYLTNYLFYLL